MSFTKFHTRRWKLRYDVSFAATKGYTESDIEQIAKKQPQEQYNFLKKELAEIGFSEAELDSIFARLFEIDRLTLNVDRHWNNFGIIFPKDEPPYLLTLFDFGYSLGVTFPRTMPTHVATRKSKAMTVSKALISNVNWLEHSL